MADQAPFIDVGESGKNGRVFRVNHPGAIATITDGSVECLSSEVATHSVRVRVPDATDDVWVVGCDAVYRVRPGENVSVGVNRTPCVLQAIGMAQVQAGPGGWVRGDTTELALDVRPPKGTSGVGWERGAWVVQSVPNKGQIYPYPFAKIGDTLLGVDDAAVSDVLDVPAFLMGSYAEFGDNRHWVDFLRFGEQRRERWRVVNRIQFQADGIEPSNKTGLWYE
jgi:hypothetical protein